MSIPFYFALTLDLIIICIYIAQLYQFFLLLKRFRFQTCASIASVLLGFSTPKAPFSEFLSTSPSIAMFSSNSANSTDLCIFIVAPRGSGGLTPNSNRAGSSLRRSISKMHKFKLKRFLLYPFHFRNGAILIARESCLCHLGSL